MNLVTRIRAWAKLLKRNALVVYYTATDERTPLWLKLLAGLTAAYAFSPIDLIPDFVPLLGLLDDAIILPVLLWLVLKYAPVEVLASAREKASQSSEKPHSWKAAMVIVIFWPALAVFLVRLAYNWTVRFP